MLETRIVSQPIEDLPLTIVRDVQTGWNPQQPAKASLRRPFEGELVLQFEQ